MTTKFRLIAALPLLLLALATTSPGARAQDAKAGAGKVAMCVGCHGILRYQTSFPEVYKVPKIAGQSAEYIVAALTEYKEGLRKFPSMRAVAESLSAQDMADIAAYYEQLGGTADATAAPAPAPGPKVQELLTQGGCAACHGEGLNKPIAPNYPKLAGQYPSYLYAALKAYQTEGNAVVGRGNPIMAGIAKQFDHAELKALAEYIGSMPGTIATVPEAEFR